MRSHQPGEDKVETHQAEGPALAKVLRQNRLPSLRYCDPERAAILSKEPFQLSVSRIVNPHLQERA